MENSKPHGSVTAAVPTAMTAAVPTAMTAAASPSSHHPSGFNAPYATPHAFVAVTAAALCVNEYHLASLGVPHVLVLAAMVQLLAVHELLRPFCCSAPDLAVLPVRVVCALLVAAAQFVARGCKPRFPEWTLGYELFQAMASTAGDLGGEHITKPLNVVGFRRVLDMLGDLLRGPACWRHGTTAEFFQHNGLEHIWVKPAVEAAAAGTEDVPAKQPVAQRTIVVLYYHGGGYSLLSPRLYTELGNRIRTQVAKAIAASTDGAAERTRVHLLLANYRKIPEYRFPVPVDDALAMYDYLVHDQCVAPSDIVIAGDSAGGGLTIATLLRLRNAEREMPAAALVICPYVDMMADIERSEHCFISTKMLRGIRDQCARAAAADSLQEAVTMSADLTGLPPLLILAGEFDILHAQSLGLEKTARSCGVDVEMDVHARMPHVFCIMPERVLAQSEVGIARLAAFAARHLVAREE